ncbi:Zn-ribbon domain-containing OB-fold protein [Zestomonas carbonaria]|uniref:ChsH2 C-terminal OB-fold domain-containing protein n=1 Tax=Zestomonas carbonaria TaxID=2762745 RepID=A0A7U7ERW8_9GAMM|nr:OB-fold domain-containing protein [Pseudomonas carbonaria]CAD5109965.1 hypothetical protein PSEWESI4_04281 [Pseudomonas carbonaria]
MNVLPSLWGGETPQRLLASRKLSSGEITFPPVSPHSPLAAQYEPLPLATEGAIYSYTVIHPSPRSGLAPFALAYLDLPGPVRIFGRVVGSERPAIGDTCRILRDDTFGYVFERVEAHQ